MLHFIEREKCTSEKFLFLQNILTFFSQPNEYLMSRIFIFQVIVIFFQEKNIMLLHCAQTMSL